MPADGDESAREGALVRFRARVEYDGTDFAGFQLQPGARTVQGELEAALGTPLRRTPGPGRRGGTHRRRGARHGPGDRIHLARAAARRRSSAGRSTRCCRRMSRSATCAGPRSGSTLATRRGTGSTATPSGTGREARSASGIALGVRDPLDTAAMARAGSVLVGRHDFSRLRGGGPPAGPDRSLGPGPAGRVRLVTIDVRGGRLPAADGAADRGRPPAGRPRQRSR